MGSRCVGKEEHEKAMEHARDIDRLGNAAEMTQKEKEFIISIIEKPPWRLTEKQVGWIYRIYKRRVK